MYTHYTNNSNNNNTTGDPPETEPLEDPGRVMIINIIKTNKMINHISLSLYIYIYIICLHDHNIRSRWRSRTCPSSERKLRCPRLAYIHLFT